MYKTNKFCDILIHSGQNDNCSGFGVPEGVTAVIGSGGKTSLIMKMAEELSQIGSTVICTTTHILRPKGVPLAETEDELVRMLAKGSPVCAGKPAAEAGKLSAPDIPVGRLAAHARYVLAEADGSRRKPLKCHADYEPVIPAEARKVILVIGLEGVGKTVGEAVHRPEIFEELTGLGSDETVTVGALAKAVTAEYEAGFFDIPGEDKGRQGRKDKPLAIFINGADTADDLLRAEELAALLPEGIECFAGSLRQGEIARIR